MSLLKITISFVIAIFIYIVWYKIVVGKFCPAMWSGTAPLLIIGIAFLSIFQILRKLGE